MADESQGLLSQGLHLRASKEVTGTFTLDDVENEITRVTGDFAEDGIEVGDMITTDSETNPGPFTVTSVSETALGVEETIETDAEGATTLTVFIEVGEATNFDGFDGQASEIDMTHLRSEAMEFRTGLPDYGSISGEMNLVAGDRGQEILFEMYGDRTRRAFMLTLPPSAGLDGYRWTFNGMVTTLPISGAVNEKMSQSLTIRITGEPEREVIEAS